MAPFFYAMNSGIQKKLPNNITSDIVLLVLSMQKMRELDVFGIGIAILYQT